MRGQSQSKKSYGNGLRTYQKQLPYSFSSWSFECFFTVFRAIPVAFLWYVFFSELALSDMVEKVNFNLLTGREVRLKVERLNILKVRRSIEGDGVVGN